MCGMATFTMYVSISSSIAASDTAIATRYLYLYLSTSTAVPEGRPERSASPPAAASGRSVVVAIGAFAPLLDVDVRRDGHPGPQRLILAAPLADRDAHRHPLHHLGEVAGRVVGRQQRELGTRGRAHALDSALRHASAVRVDFELHRLPDLQVGELRLLEVGGHPHTRVRHDGEQRLPRLHELPDLDLLPRDDAAHRRHDARVRELK